MKAQWRTNNAYDSICLLDDDDKVVQAAQVGKGSVLRDFLLAHNYDEWSLDPVEPPNDTTIDYDQYGELVMERDSIDGAVTELDADLFRARLAFWA